jgi:hypothetical protein
MNAPIITDALSILWASNTHRAAKVMVDRDPVKI